MIEDNKKKMAVLIWGDEHMCFPSGSSFKVSSKTVELWSVGKPGMEQPKAR